MNDLISKSEVYKLFNNGCGIEKIHVVQIDDIPIVDAEPVKHGYWVKERFASYIGSISVDKNGEPIARECIGYHCSLCGRYEHEIQPYCNCGARMDEVRE